MGILFDYNNLLQGVKPKSGECYRIVSALRIPNKLHLARGIC
jgi:hypothetical protein